MILWVHLGSIAEASFLILSAIVEGKVYMGQGTQCPRTLLGQLPQLVAAQLEGHVWDYGEWSTCALSTVR